MNFNKNSDLIKRTKKQFLIYPTQLGVELKKMSALIVNFFMSTSLSFGQANDSTFTIDDPSLSQLKTFTTDGCTGVPTNLSNFNSYDDFAHCCIVHDVVYWIGGSTTDKNYADDELIACLNDANGITNLTNIAAKITLETIGLDLWGRGWYPNRSLNQEFSQPEISEVIGKLKNLIANEKDFNFQFRMNERQNQYIGFWLETFLNGFSSSEK